MTQLDLSILDWIQAHLRCGVLDAGLPWITALGDYGAFWILLALVLLAVPRTRRLGVAMTAALVLDVVLCNGVLKPLVARPRPFTFRPELELLVAPPRDFSFPSGHTAASFAAAAALLGMRSRSWIPAMALALAIGLSRLYLYVHYPTDVFCGALLGFACGILGAIFAKKALAFCKNRKK